MPPASKDYFCDCPALCRSRRKVSRSTFYNHARHRTAKTNEVFQPSSLAIHATSVDTGVGRMSLSASYLNVPSTSAGTKRPLTESEAIVGQGVKRTRRNEVAVVTPHENQSSQAGPSTYQRHLESLYERPPYAAINPSDMIQHENISTPLRDNAARFTTLNPLYDLREPSPQFFASQYTNTFTPEPSSSGSCPRTPESSPYAQCNGLMINHGEASGHDFKYWHPSLEPRVYYNYIKERDRMDHARRENLALRMRKSDLEAQNLALRMQRSDLKAQLDHGLWVLGNRQPFHEDFISP